MVLVRKNTSKETKITIAVSAIEMVFMLPMSADSALSIGSINSALPTPKAKMIAARFSIGSFVFLSRIQINAAPKSTKGNTPANKLQPKIMAIAAPGSAKCANGPATTDIFLDNIKVPR